MFDLQSILQNHIAAQRAEEMETSEQLTLGEMIRKLEAISLTYEDHTGETQPKLVWFDFAQTYPCQLSSWRGSYCELAIEFDYNGRLGGRPRPDEAHHMEAPRLLAMLRSAIGATFTGYKGGDFVMGETTPVWVANYGDSGNTGVVGIRDDPCEIVIETGWCDY